MPNTSATGGYLVPAALPETVYDEAFENFLHDVFVGLTGFSNDHVRPRWQPEPPNQLPAGDDWMAFGVTRIPSDTYAYVGHNPLASGSDDMQHHETVELLISMYGPNAAGYLARIRDGLLIDQNRAIMIAAGIGQTQTGDMTPAPSVVKERWLRRFDMTMTFQRCVLRSYPILNLLSAQGTLNAEVVQTSINVTGP